MKSYKKEKKSIVAGSPAAMEHEAMMEQVNASETLMPSPATSASEAQAAPAAIPVPQQHVSVFSQQMNGEPMKNVQTRITLSAYEKLLHMKYFAGQRTSLGDIINSAIMEFIENHPV